VSSSARQRGRPRRCSSIPKCTTSGSLLGCPLDLGLLPSLGRLLDGLALTLERLAAKLVAASSRCHAQVFLVADRNGRWDRAEQVPGLAALNAGAGAGVVSVSCAPGGYCGAGGYYTDGSNHQHPFVVTGVTSVSCWSAGSCAAAGRQRVPAAGAGAARGGPVA
jgi:hypothetical protein